MKKLRYMICLFLAIGSGLVLAEDKAKPNDADKKITEASEIITAGGISTPKGWYDDYDSALATAKKKQRPMLILFTGSDWCHWCVKLRQEVLDKDEFMNFAKENLVLLYVDSPSAKIALSAEQRAKNELVSKKLKKGGGVPATLLLNYDEKALGDFSGFSPAYIDKIKELLPTK